jgi:lipopolysaccharide biosynthesis glycosyltransferase
MSITAISILNNAFCDIEFHVMDCGITEEDKRQLLDLCGNFSNFCRITFYPIDVEKEFVGCQTYRGFSLNPFAYFMFPVVNESVERCIVVNTDICVVGDMKELNDESLDGNVIGAVPDIGAGAMHKEYAFGCADHKYFNSGVLLVDCRAWRQQDCTKKLLAIAKKHNQDFYCDQDTLNRLFLGNKYKVLPFRYNLLFCTNRIKKFFPDLDDMLLKNEWQHAVVLHYAGVKPWDMLVPSLSTVSTRGYADFWYYASRTKYFVGLFCELLQNNGVPVTVAKLFSSLPSATQRQQMHDCCYWVSWRTYFKGQAKGWYLAR